MAEDDFERACVAAPTPAGRRYRILRDHAKGGLGLVRVAHDAELDREVAMKEIQDRHADDPNSRARFMLEAQVTGRLEHPGIVPVYSVGRHANGRPFYIMRLIRGETLTVAIRRFHQAEVPGRDPGKVLLALHRLLRRYLDVCDAVAYAHDRKVIHRDIKPDNILLGPYGETLLVDWGLAKLLPETRGGAGTLSRVQRTPRSLFRFAGIPGRGEGPVRPASADDMEPTRAGSRIGTPQYMSPEQAAGRLDLLGPASDVYSLGATLFCLLTGRAPFPSPRDARGGLEAVLRRVVSGDFPGPCAVNGEIPRALEAICLKAMALDPESRYGSPRELAADLERWLAGEPVSVWREPWSARASRWMGRYRRLVPILCLGVLATGTVGLVLWLLREDRAKAERLQRGSSFYFEATSRLCRQVADHQRLVGHLGAAERRPDDVSIRLAEGALVGSESLVTFGGPSNPMQRPFRGNLGGAYHNLGRLLASSGRIEEALKAYQRAVDHQRAALDMGFGSGTVDPDLDRRLLSVYCRNLARAQEKVGRATEAASTDSFRVAFWRERRKQPPEAMFDDACELALCASLVSRDPAERARFSDEAIGALRQAIRFGLSPTRLERDPMLDPLRHRDDFRSLMSPGRGRRGPPGPA